MDLITGLLTIALITLILKLMGVNKEDLFITTIAVILCAIPAISNLGKYVLDLFK